MWYHAHKEGFLSLHGRNWCGKSPIFGTLWLHSVLLLMVHKSGIHQLRGKEVYPSYIMVFYIPGGEPDF